MGVFHEGDRVKVTFLEEYEFIVTYMQQHSVGTFYDLRSVDPILTDTLGSHHRVLRNVAHKDIYTPKESNG